MKVIVGLGNPGKEYQNTRHNAGYFIVEKFQENWGFEDFKTSKFFGIISEWILSGEKIILLKPTTYMNLSGKSVGALVQFYKLASPDILVISDDIDMDFGKIRMRKQGSSGGQNGLKSIIEWLGTDSIARLKIGIGRDSRYSVSDWVLSRFKEDEIRALQSDLLNELEIYTKNWIWKI